MINTKGLFETLIGFGIAIGIIVFMIIWGIYWLFSEPKGIIRTENPIVPEIELVVEDNMIDTVYVYRKP